MKRRGEMAAWEWMKWSGLHMKFENEDLRKLGRGAASGVGAENKTNENDHTPFFNE